MNYESFTEQELNKMFDSAFQIKVTFESREDWHKLICDDEIYRHLWLLLAKIMNEQKRRIVEK